MVEIKGFNEAYKAMLAKETVKKIHKKHTDNRVKELIAQGVDKEIFTSEDLDFMNKELGRQAGAVFARILRAIKKKDFKEAQRVITGGKSR